MGLLGCSQNSSSPPNKGYSPTPSTATGKIVIADINKNASKKIQEFQPMADYLASHLTQFGIGTGEVKVAQDFETIANWLKTGEVDLYFDSPYPAMRISQMSGAKPILRRWKSRQGTYSGVIFIMANSKINSVKDLQGKMIAFEEPVSTSGYVLPLNILLKAGLKTVEKSSTEQLVLSDEVGYVFSNDDENTIQWVISGRVDAGAADDRAFNSIPAQSRQEMKILAQTDKVARQIVLVKPGMNPEKQAAIKSILINMDKTEAGKQVLETFEKTTKFDEYPVEADLKKLQEIYEKIN
ncbi:ABC-type phosphate/phosphonate transport system periplasmic component-like protein [Gloeothece citriformis PCC 7424]|uniref:ABC-type phosphate/phosphonate transport system periplasmic component-like protein n=2 Tax=Gloeothece TaxID=28070 RepID=B7KDV2_GLOC7|nr:ABC-type phosphate/phosphonate transport system periplasmic component-like protein [Gloeothece citriformis PCC 7424]